MRAAIFVLLLPHAAAANEFFDLQQAATSVATGHLDVRVPKAMSIQPMRFAPVGDTGSLDYGTAIFTMKATPVHLDETLALCVAAKRDLEARGITGVSLEPLRMTASLSGCAATPTHGDLLFAAYVASADGVDLLAFSVDEGGSGARSTWITLARRITESAAPPSHSVGEWTIRGGSVTSTRRGWLVSVRGGWCRLSNEEEHTEANSNRVGPSGAWMRWKDKIGADIIATRTLEPFHADCHASTERALTAARSVVETLHR